LLQVAKVPPMVHSLLGAKVRGNESSIMRFRHIVLCSLLYAYLGYESDLLESRDVIYRVTIWPFWKYRQMSDKNSSSR